MIQKKHLDTNSFTCIISASIKSLKMQRSPNSGPVITLSGAPGGGKTTILELLKKRNSTDQSRFKFFDEISRGLQKEFCPITGKPIYDAVERPDELTKAIIKRRILDIQEAKESKLISVLDRNLTDSLGYYDTFKDPQIDPINDVTRNKLVKLCLSYPPDLVLFFPFWPEIYVNDEGRCENPELAQLISNSIYNALRELRIPFYVVPEGSPEARYDFVMEQIHSVTHLRTPL